MFAVGLARGLTGGELRPALQRYAIGGRALDALRDNLFCDGGHFPHVIGDRRRPSNMGVPDNAAETRHTPFKRDGDA